MSFQISVSGAGIIILPRPDGLDEEEPTEDVDMLESEQAPLWPRKPGIPCSDLFDPEDSWFDAPPEGFSVTVRVHFFLLLEGGGLI